MKLLDNNDSKSVSISMVLVGKKGWKGNVKFFDTKCGKNYAQVLVLAKESTRNIKK